MLQLLHIENVAVIECADIEFSGGLNVLTGETGAGKSIVIDALNAVTGARMSKDIVRTGAKSAGVTAVFDPEGAEDWCEENGIEYSEDGLYIMRKISADGKNTCKVNGTPVTVSQLAELGSILVDVHGQNDGRRLLDESSHLNYLDYFGGISGDLSEYREAYEKMRQKEKEIDALNMDEGERERRIDMLKRQISELRGAQLHEGELESITARRDLMKNASKLTDDCDIAISSIDGNDDSDGAAALVAEAENAVQSASRYSEALSDIASRLKEVKYLLSDIAADIHDFVSDLDFSPEEYDELEGRIDVLRRLSKKYGSDETEMLAYLEKCEAELDAISGSSDKIYMLQKDLTELTKKAGKLADSISVKRKKAASVLESRVTEELSQLSMKGTKFTVSVMDEEKLSVTGRNEVRFLISANPGEAPGRISKIASGGELSRIMLAMKNVLSEGEPAATLVFDEIDTGVSGIAAQRVGEKLFELGRTKQVLCVSHLPQIAAIADSQYSIVKDTRDGRTFTDVNELDLDGRKRELARLIGGENVTELTLNSAEELIGASDAYKASRT